jgi:hypothetical protein
MDTGSEDRELAQRLKLLSEEVADLEASIQKKNAELSTATNPIIKVNACAAVFCHQYSRGCSAYVNISLMCIMLTSG